MKCLIKNILFVILIISYFKIGYTQNINFNSHLVDASFSSPSGIFIIDINNDEKNDILAAGGNSVACWENLGGTPVVWNKSYIDQSFTGAIYVSSGDIDNDGNHDVIGAAWEGNEIAWWHNNGGDWTKQIIKADYTDAHEVMAFDVDSDGDLDVITVSAGLDRIDWFENDGNYPVTWTEHMITENFDGARSVDAGDINNDGYIDFTGAALLDHEIAYWENNKDTPTTWTKHILNSGFLYAHKVQLVDMDGDGDLDVLGVAYNEGLKWWENDGETNITWTEHTIASFYSAVIGEAFDYDNDGDKDIVATAQGSSKIAYWENLDNNSLEWNYFLIESFGGAWPLAVSDIDADGDADFVAGGNSVGDIKWYENDLINNETVTDFDGNIYNTVTIGDQIWLKENLKSLHYSDGSEITEVWSYNDNEAYADTFGRLYTWDAAMNYSTDEGVQGVCPDDWHLPTDSEWTELSNYLGGDEVAGGKLKSIGTEYWQEPNTGATNESGFTALPAGEYDDTHYQLLYQYAVMWSSTETSGTWCKYRYLAYNDNELHTYNYYKDFRYSVRCIKDNPTSIESENMIENKIFITPNPTNGRIRIDLSGINDFPQKMELYNITGKLMRSIIIVDKNPFLDVSDFIAGIYVIMIHTNGGLITEKFIKN